MDKKITINDVAKCVGVSKAAVSRALNGKGEVSADTVRKIEEAVKQLGYSPRSYGTSQVKRKESKSKCSNRVLFLVYGRWGSWMRHSFYAKMPMCVERELKKLGKAMVLTTVEDDSEFSSSAFFKTKFDGVVFMGDVDTPATREFMRKHVAVRVMGKLEQSLYWDHVSYDNPGIGACVANYFLQKGIQTSLVINKQGDMFTERATSFQDHFLANGGVVATILEGQNIYDPQWRKIKEQLQRCQNQTLGIFSVADDMTTLLHRRMLLEQDWHPEKQILVSCNNDFPMLSAVHPCPPSIDLNIEGIAEVAVSKLTERMTNPKVEKTSTAIPVHLVTDVYEEYQREINQ